ncbi:MAG TPA: PIG-L deacetylase family protein [Burkholderiales bacterium]|nr:PIG-L deacetylase family protein [Burkholderiales bacterium]
MLRLVPEIRAGRPLRLLCIGAHSDDLEIGCGATVMSWLAGVRRIEVTWVVLSAEGVRASEAHRSARALLARATKSRVVIGSFRDGHLPGQYVDVKGFFEDLKGKVNPDVVLTHWLGDRHQDHRLAADLTWNTWRNHVVLEYEIPKYEGDLAPPNAYVPISAAIARRKVGHLRRYFSSQRSKDWFVAENFLGLMRLRGLESRSPSGFAEAFHARKLVL